MRWVAALSATLVATVASASVHPSEPQLPATLLSDAAVDEHTATVTALNTAHASHATASHDSHDSPDRAAAAVHHDLLEHPQGLCTEVPNVDFGGPQPVSITRDALLCRITMLQSKCVPWGFGLGMHFAIWCCKFKKVKKHPSTCHIAAI